jgi:general L-amino acid transport system substrate-binding protein
VGLGSRILLLALLTASSASVHASVVLDRIRADNVLHCGATERPGFAEAEGPPTGVLIDICRAVSIAVQGPSARVSFTIYDSSESYDAVRQGKDEVAFLSGGEIADQALSKFVVPGPTAVISAVGVMVPDTSRMQRLDDLAGQIMCLMIGSRAQRGLESAVERRHLIISRSTFQEDMELLDAYNAGNCDAVVGETTYLADMQRNPGIRHIISRLLPDVLAADPIIAATPRSDGDWAATVGWVIDGLLLADAPSDRWVSGAPVGELRSGWQQDVSAVVGSYGAIIRRHLTERLGLPPGPNALWPAGLLMPPAAK